MASNDEYQQQREWSQIKRKPCFHPNDGSQMAIDAAIYFAEREREMWFKDVKGVSGIDVRLFQDKELNNITNGNNRDSKESV